jgi:pyruvate dehydrogenase E2 component (dihydrolipoamide acetyltransferase)
MPREIKMPKLSDTMEEGTLNVWRKSEGEAIAKGDVLLEIETDKADMEFEAYMSGTLVKILIPAGETVPIGTPIAIVRLERDSDEDLAAFLASREGGAAAPKSAAPATPAPAAATAPSPAAALAPAPVAASAPAAVPTPASPTVPAGPFAAATLPEPTSRLPWFFADPDRVRATPRARLIARDRGADLSEIAGSGPDGAVLVSDIERYLEALEASPDGASEGDVAATPVAARIADEHGIDLSGVKGTGPGGRITKRDIRDHLEREAREGPARDASLYGDEIKLSQKRKFLIRNMVESKQSAPHFYISMDVDAGPLRALRERFKRESRRVTYTHMIMKAAALALEQIPEANATFRENRILRFNHVNIAVAVAVQDELLAPVVKECQGTGLEDLALRTDALIEKARERKLAPEDYSDGTFTISNLGMMGVDHFYAIITPPQSMVLSVGSVRSVACVAEDGSIVAGQRIDFGLACDHRVVDGAKAARVLEAIKQALENPESLLGTGSDDGA